MAQPSSIAQLVPAEGWYAMLARRKADGTVWVEARPLVAWALWRYEQGADDVHGLIVLPVEENEVIAAHERELIAYSRNPGDTTRWLEAAERMIAELEREAPGPLPEEER